jgi:hypothetical protein
MTEGQSDRTARSSAIRREIGGIALLLFAVFLAGALATFALAELRTGVDVRGNVGWLGYWLARPIVAFIGWPARRFPH